MELENDISQVIFSLFNNTLNKSAENSLKKIITNKLTTQNDIKDRNLIIKTFINNIGLFESYSYPFIHHREVFLNLDQGSFRQVLTNPNPLKTLKSNKKINQELKGKSIQLILFFEFYYSKYIEYFDFENFPKNYKIEFINFKKYFESLNLSHYTKLIKSKKFNTIETLEVIEIINKNFVAQKQFIFTEFFSNFEAYISITKSTLKHQLNFAQVNSETIVIEDLYHPQLNNPIKNPFKNLNGVALLTGANMAGKSTFLKAFGICVYLAHVGLPIPAKKAEIPFYDKIYLFINNNDDLLNGYSYFMQEILNVKKVTLDCMNNKSCFVLFDELFRGTNFEDALDILKTTLKGLLKFKNSFFMISTHIHQLKETISSEKNINSYYLESIITNKQPHFTFKLKEGFSDLKLGRILFDSEKLNELLS